MTTVTMSSPVTTSPSARVSSPWTSSAIFCTVITAVHRSITAPETTAAGKSAGSLRSSPAPFCSPVSLTAASEPTPRRRFSRAWGRERGMDGMPSMTRKYSRPGASFSISAWGSYSQATSSGRTRISLPTADAPYGGSSMPPPAITGSSVSGSSTIS